MFLYSLHLYKRDDNYKTKSTSSFNFRLIQNNSFRLNQDKISFQKVSVPSKETMQYLEDANKYYADRFIELNDMNKLDLNKINDICAGIPVFENWDAIDLFFATRGFESILLSRGCYKQCSHCGAGALLKVKFMKWENFTEFVDGIGVLKERLGFNPFGRGSLNYITPFHDSDPVDYRQKDDKGILRTIFDASKYFYDKTGSKFYITTAGWASENKVVQQAMEKIVEDSESVRRIMVSVHSFHNLMAKSIEFKKQGNFEKAEVYRKKYIDMMANVMKTLAPLAQKDKLIISIPYENSFDELSYHSGKQLLLEIIEKIKSIDPDCYFAKSKGRIETLYRDCILEYRQIQVEGRAQSLIGRSRKAHNPLNKENLEDAKKYINIDGTVLASEPDTNLDTEFFALPKKLKFTKAPEVYNEYTYPILQETDLIYSVSNEATALNKKINSKSKFKNRTKHIL